MMPAAISEDEFLDALRTFRRSAFRLETRGDSYALGYEAADFARFLAGSPVHADRTRLVAAVGWTRVAPVHP